VDPKQFDVGDQVIGRVGAQLDSGIAGMWCAAATPALIKQHNAIRGGIEQLSHRRYTAGPGRRARQRGLTVGIATRFPVDAVPIATSSMPDSYGSIGG